MAVLARDGVVCQIDHGQVAAKERLPIDRLRLLAHDVHGGGIDQRVAGAAGNGDGGARESAGGGQKPGRLAQKKDHGRNRNPRIGRGGAAALRPAAEDVGGAAVGRKDGLDRAVEGERRAVVVAWLRRYCRDSASETGTRRAHSAARSPRRPWARWKARRSRRAFARRVSCARIVDVIGVLHKGQRHGPAGIHADAVHAGKARERKNCPRPGSRRSRHATPGWRQRRSSGCG